MGLHASTEVASLMVLGGHFIRQETKEYVQQEKFSTYLS